MSVTPLITPTPTPLHQSLCDIVFDMGEQGRCLLTLSSHSPIARIYFTHLICWNARGPDRGAL